MMKRRMCFWLSCLVLIWILLPTVPAQDGGEEDTDVATEELVAAMQRFFANGLRSELALSDAQMEQILPKIEEVTKRRTQAHRERAQIVRRLNQGLREGATDVELRGLLDELDRLEAEAQELERSARAEIDGMLTVRQSVKYRFFAQRFRQEMNRRIQDMRGRRGMGRDQRRRGRP